MMFFQNNSVRFSYTGTVDMAKFGILLALKYHDLVRPEAVHQQAYSEKIYWGKKNKKQKPRCVTGLTIETSWLMLYCETC